MQNYKFGMMFVPLQLTPTRYGPVACDWQ